MLQKKKFLDMKFRFAICGTLLFSACDLEPAGLSEKDLFGTWMMSSAVITNRTVIHTAGNGRDSVAADDTTVKFTNNNDFFIYHSDMTYYQQFDDNILGNTGMIADTGTWTLSGWTLTIRSQQSPEPFTSTLDLNGDSIVITTTVASDSQPGYNTGDYTLFRQDLAVFAQR
jgi:hypothetical protein